MRVQRIASIAEPRISEESFKVLLTQLKYSISDSNPQQRERYEVLVQAFTSSVSGQQDKPDALKSKTQQTTGEG
jgi:hypothetical protein